MFNQIFACIILAALALQIFKGAAIYIEYYANTAAFAKNCENKARPQMHCNGKCQLMKKLSREEKKDNQAPERRIAFHEIISSKSFFTAVSYFPIERKFIFSLFQASSIIDRPHSIFHPPGDQAA